MINYQQQICPHCQGSGIVQRGHMLELSCPLCGGRGTINDFEHPLPDETGEPHPPPGEPCCELLARIVPLGGRTSGVLLHQRRQRYKPLGVPLYHHNRGRGRSAA
jgi:hypothetical protein